MIIQTNEAAEKTSFVPSTFKKYMVIDGKNSVDYANKYGMHVDLNGLKVNQLLDRTNSKFNSKYSAYMNLNFTNNNDGTFTFVSNNLTGLNTWVSDYQIPIRIDAGDKFLISGIGNCTGVNLYFYRTESMNGQYILNEGIFTANSDKNNYGMYIGRGEVFKIGNSFNYTIKPVIVNLTKLGLADKNMQWIQSNRPDLLQNTDYIPNTITIEPKIMEVK